MFDPKTMNPEEVAKLLRKPSGPFARELAEQMHKGNLFLINLTLETMDLKPGDKVLEIGFGGGRSFEGLFSKERNLSVSGIDYSEDMVEAAKAINKNEVESGKLKLYLGSSESLPFADGTFDKVYCNNVIYFWEEPSVHLKEIRRVLKPGGIFYTGIRTKESMLQMPVSQYGFTLYEEEDWRGVLEKNGFRSVMANKKNDPVFEVEGHEFRFVSVCIAGEKVHRPPSTV